MLQSWCHLSKTLGKDLFQWPLFCSCGNFLPKEMVKFLHDPSQMTQAHLQHVLQDCVSSQGEKLARIIYLSMGALVISFVMACT